MGQGQGQGTRFTAQFGVSLVLRQTGKERRARKRARERENEREGERTRERGRERENERERGSVPVVLVSDCLRLRH